ENLIASIAQLTGRSPLNGGVESMGAQTPAGGISDYSAPPTQGALSESKPPTLSGPNQVSAGASRASAKRKEKASEPASRPDGGQVLICFPAPEGNLPV